MARTKASDEPVEPDEEPTPDETPDARQAFLAGEMRWRDYVAAERGDDDR